MAVVLVFAAPASTPHAETLTSDIVSQDLIETMREWAQHPVTLIALRAQNARHTGLSQEDIDQLDKDWRAQRKSQGQPLIAQLFGSPLSTYLTRIQAQSGGLYTEIFVMDNRGLNVGQSAVTSDYWQGDEGKWQKTFGVGPDAVFIDAAEAHEGTGTTRAQVNLAIADPDTGKAIGAITVEVNLTELARRQSL